MQALHNTKHLWWIALFAFFLCILPGQIVGSLNAQNRNPTYDSVTVKGALTASTVNASVNGVVNPCAAPYNAKCDGVTDDSVALQAAITAAEAQTGSSSGVVFVPPGKNILANSTMNIVGYVTIEGAVPREQASGGGSGLIYGGTSSAFLVENGSPSNYTYVVSFKNLYFHATAAATSFIHFYGINGPSDVEGNVFDGNSLAATAVIYDLPGGGLQTLYVNNYSEAFTGNEVVCRACNNFVFKANQFFDTYGAGLYASNPQGMEISNNYFELMPTGIEIANDDENHLQVDIHDNSIRVDQSPPISNPVATVNQRCILIKSTTNGYPFYGQGSIKHNDCNLSPDTTTGLIQGIAPYGIDFETASNTFYVNQQWMVEDNSIAGITTAGIYNDNTAIVIEHTKNQAITVWTPGSSIPTYLPVTAGPGTFMQALTASTLTAGQSTCVYSTSPLVIGYCTSATSGSGSCTCVK